MWGLNWLNTVFKIFHFAIISAVCGCSGCALYCYQCMVNAVLQHHTISWSPNECFVAYEDPDTCSEEADCYGI
jgi:hypothetical protein